MRNFENRDDFYFPGDNCVRNKGVIFMYYKHKKEQNRKRKTKVYQTSAQPAFIGDMIHISRRTNERKFFLKITKKNIQILEYCLASSASKHKIIIHNYCFMTNHYHLLITDLEGRYPAFLADLNRNIAKCLNVSYDHLDSIWDSRGPTVVRLSDNPANVSRVMEYIYLNPCKAKLVKHQRHYPGVKSVPDDLKGRSRKIKRPQVYFAKDGKLPKSVRLKVQMPTNVLKVMDKKSYIAHMKERVRAGENKVIAEVGENGFMGKSKLRNIHHLDSPRTRPSFGKLNPKVSGATGEDRVRQKTKYKHFCASYEESFHRWQRGERDVEFPYGTYQMQHIHKVRVAEKTPILEMLPRDEFWFPEDTG